MRIGFDATVLAPETRYTGAGQYAEMLLRHLPALTPADTIVAYGAPHSVRQELAADNVEWRDIPQLPFGKLSRFASHIFFLPGLVARDRIDVFHAPTVHTRPSLAPVPRRLPSPLVVTLHDVIPLTFYRREGPALPVRMRAYYRWNLGAVRKARRIVTVSEASRREILANLPLDGKRVVTVHNGVEFGSGPEASLDSVLPGVRPYVLFAGGFEPRKNLKRVLRAFSAAVAQGLPYNLVMVVEKGSGHAGRVLPLVRGLACEERLRFVSGLDGPSLQAVYRGAEMFVFPSLAEGFGFPPLQAMSCAVPVIASGIPALREVLGEAALFVDPRSVESIAGAMCRLASDGRLRSDLAAAGPAQAGKFRWGDAAGKTLQVLRAAAGRPGTVPVA